MERILSGERPSALRPACAPVAPAPATQAYALGQPAVAALFSTRLLPVSGFAGATSVKIHNCMGTTSAKGEGMTLSIIADQSASRVHTVQVVKVKGGDARGIPPRGRPV